MRVGHINGEATLDGNKLPVDGVAVVGNATTTMPSEGVFNYAGDATHRTNGAGNTIEYGSSVFTADFVKKNLDGTLSFATAGDIGLKASITGNQFSGAAADNAGYNTEGGFYGEDGKYLGGVYDGNGAQGTYGATKGAEVIPEPEEPPVRERGEKSTKTGAQTINIGGAFITSTREFDVYDNGNNLDARADTASTGLLPTVPVFVSGDNDIDLANGYKSNVDDSATIVAGAALENAKIPLTYTSVYKDFDGDMRVGHINGEATLDGNKLPVDGVAVVGNATTTMPSEGVFNYAGDATHRTNGAGNTIEYGSSVFTADFVKKNLDGTLSFATAGDIGLKASITGNQFSGAAADNAGYNTEGGFYGEDGKYLGGVYDGNGAQGTYGAIKGAEVKPPLDNPDVKPDTGMTGFQSTALSSLKSNSSLLKKFDDAIGYVDIRDDKSEFTTTKQENGAKVPVDNRKGDNFTGFSTLKLRADMVQPESVTAPITVSLGSSGSTGSVQVTAGSSPKPDFNYTSVYENFDQQMQVGHVYGLFNSAILGNKDISKAANVYVQGHLTDQADIDYLKQVNEGKAQYAGKATYIENIHLGDVNTGFKPVNGTSAFDIDFVNNSVKGQLDFAAGNYKYMPAGNKIAIDTDITGNTFASNKNGIDTAGGFYGEDAKFLGGIYQDASVQGGKGTTAGTGTKFQGTFGAEKQ